MNTLEILQKRLETYPGAHPNENWKRETDLNKCTPREKARMMEYGLTVEDFMKAGHNRGEVAHMLYGYENELRKAAQHD